MITSVCRVFGVMLLAVGLSACASMRGSQEWLTASDIQRIRPVCPADADLQPAATGELAGSHRDRIISGCIKIINFKYAQFTERLSYEAGGTNLATDLISQSLATAASVVTKEGLARKLAGGSALSLGIGASINKDLFYKQTLPAIIASMDARRSKVLTTIAQAQNTDPEAKVYTLARAGQDIDLLQQAGSLNSAVRELTSAAVQNAAVADAARQVAETTIDIGTAQPITAEMDQRYHSAVAMVRRMETAKRTAELHALAASLGLAPSPGLSTAVLSAIIRAELAKVTTSSPDKQVQVLERMEGAIAPYRGI